MMAPATLALLLVLLPLLPGQRGGGHALSPPREFEPVCRTDHVSHIACRWPADASTDCAREFRLRYRRGSQGNFSECIPEGETEGGAHSSCTCIIPGEGLRHAEYDMLLEANGVEQWHGTVTPDNIVKPLPLKLFSPKKDDENRSFRFTWKSAYNKTSPIYDVAADYELIYWPKGKRKEEQNCSEKTSCEIFADELLSGMRYVASVRYRLHNYGKIWSEWSSEVEWTNDFEPQHRMEAWFIILILCLLAVSLILICYCSIARMKSQWWDRIPSPAKSKMVETMGVIKQPKLMFPDAGKMHAAIEDTCKVRSWNKHGASPFSQTGSETGLSNSDAEKQAGFLMPEDPPVACPLVVNSAASATQPDLHEDKEEVKAPHEDIVAGLFKNLLSGDLSVWGNPSILDPLSQGDALPITDKAIEVPESGSEPCCTPLKQSLGKFGDKDASELWEMSAEPAFQNSTMEREAIYPLTLSPSPGLPMDCGLPSWQSQIPSALWPHTSTTSICKDGGGPWTSAQDAGGPLVTPSGGYKSFNSLVANSQAHEGQLVPPQEGQICSPSIEAGLCPAPESCRSSQVAYQNISLGEPDPLCLSFHKMSTWLPPSPLGADPELHLQKASGKLLDLSGPAAPLISNYQCFSSALQNQLVP